MGFRVHIWFRLKASEFVGGPLGSYSRGRGYISGSVAFMPLPPSCPNQITRQQALHFSASLLKGSWDLVTGVTKEFYLLITITTPIRELITLLAKSHDPSSNLKGLGKFRVCARGLGF